MGHGANGADMAADWNWREVVDAKASRGRGSGNIDAQHIVPSRAV